MTANRSEVRMANRSPIVVTFARACHAEWIKLRSQRIVWAGILVAVLAVFFLGIAAASGAERADDIDATIERSRQAYSIVSGHSAAVLVFLLLGVASIGNEYSSGLIRVTLTVLPRRGIAFAARATVLGLTAFFTAIVAFTVTATVTGVILADKGYRVPYTDAYALSVLAGAIVALPLVALVGLAFGTLLRSNAGGILAALLVFLAVPFCLDAAALALDEAWPANLSRILPSINLPWTMATPFPPDVRLDQFDLTGRLQLFTWQAWALLTAWTALLLSAAYSRFRRRPA